MVSKTVVKQGIFVAKKAHHDSGNSAAAKPAVSAHPAFPAVVALWFAALLGVGSLILPVRLFESIITAAQIDSIFAAAAPPLGFSARAGIALGFTIIGAVLGFAIARLASRSEQKPARRRLMPIDPHKELNEEGLDPARNGPRRRALAIETEAGPSEYLDIAPLPGAKLNYAPDEDAPDFSAPDFTQEEYVAEEHTAEEYVAEVSEPAADEALELIEEAPEEMPLEQAQIVAEAPSEEAVGPGFSLEFTEQQDELATMVGAASVEDQHMHDKQVFAPVGQFDGPVATNGDEGVDESVNEMIEPQVEQPAPAFASPQSVGEDAPAPEAEPAAEAEPIAEPLPFSPPAMAATDENKAPQMPAKPAATTPGSDADLGDLGLVQLVERMRASLEKRRAAQAVTEQAEPEQTPAAAVTADAPRAVPTGFDVADANEAAVAMAAFFGPAAGGQTKQAAPAAPEAPAAPQAPETHAEPVAERQIFVPQPAAEPAPAPAPRQGERYGEMPGFAASASGAGQDNDDEDEHDSEIASLAASFSLPLGKRVQMAAAASAHQSEDAAKIAEAAPASVPAPFDPPAEAASQSPAVPAPFDPPAEANTTQLVEPQDEVDGEEEGLDENSYPSLLKQKNPFKHDGQEFVRIDEPEPELPQSAVVFPAERAAPKPVQEQALAPAPRMFDRPEGEGAPQKSSESARPRPSNDDNDRALREALMNLQRMGKAV